MSEGVRVFGDEVGDARRGAECADSERSGVTSSGGPRGRLEMRRFRFDRKGSTDVRHTQKVEGTSQALAESSQYS